ncbi:alkene reductase [Sphingomonas jatrophae]|uniref:2,4-dienoyl-CoA reductase n=1 Tax=Sphingomonas jatrophae TaxID=1166337 RepID=A0A1I6LQK4_9SPHN|nr:alkene reductase [Sphingomonas jatrophae]SFS05532.1 2,4-dienoyl-CoA reductase [Sphingomonas jatrophae]
MTGLFDPIRLGAIAAPNRIVMAPMTRARATRDHVPTSMMADYYAQRASAGLILSEAIGISQEGLGWPFAPGLWSDAQTEAWKPVTAAVHDAGGRIAAQLWHMGRIVHPSYLGGAAPVSSSATTAPGKAHIYGGKAPFVEARPLGRAELPRLLDDYARAADNALAAGFDGVQLHAANGYLIDQFLRDNVNLRDDAYGGSIDNRIRLLREVVERLAATVGADRVGVRLSPNGEMQGVNDSAPHDLFPAAAAALSEIGIAYLELREPEPEGTFGKPDTHAVAPAIRAAFNGPLVLNSDYTPERAAAVIAAGEADAIAFGRPYIANPDLVERIAGGVPLAKDDMRTWYSQGAEGYLDYPTAEAVAA